MRRTENWRIEKLFVSELGLESEKRKGEKRQILGRVEIIWKCFNSNKRILFLRDLNSKAGDVPVQ